MNVDANAMVVVETEGSESLGGWGRCGGMSTVIRRTLWVVMMSSLSFLDFSYSNFNLAVKPWLYPFGFLEETLISVFKPDIIILLL